MAWRFWKPGHRGNPGHLKWSQPKTVEVESLKVGRLEAFGLDDEIQLELAAEALGSSVAEAKIILRGNRPDAAQVDADRRMIAALKMRARNRR